MPTTHTHYVPRPPVDEQPLTPNTLRAAASTLIFGRRPSATRLSTAAQLPENTRQSILEFLDDDARARAEGRSVVVVVVSGEGGVVHLAVVVAQQAEERAAREENFAPPPDRALENFSPPNNFPLLPREAAQAG